MAARRRADRERLVAGPRIVEVDRAAVEHRIGAGAAERHRRVGERFGQLQPSKAPAHNDDARLAQVLDFCKSFHKVKEAVAQARG